MQPHLAIKVDGEYMDDIFDIPMMAIGSIINAWEDAFDLGVDWGIKHQEEQLIND